MNKSQILKQVEKTLKDKFFKDSSGHDWWHIDRTRKLSIRIAESEPKADIFIVELGALLHDISDYKFSGGDDKAGGKAAAKLLHALKLDESTIAAVCHIVDNVSFMKSGFKNEMQSLEGKIVQDADRLEALGAIGVARAIAYGAWKGKPIYDPNGKIRQYKNSSEYKKGSSDSSIHHIYEKAFLLKDRMNTKLGKKIALTRHRFMEKFMSAFLDEWNGKQ